VEEQFYLLWPLAVYRLNHRTLIKLCVALVIAALAVRTGLRLADLTPAAFVLLPARADALVMGALLALLAREPEGLNRLTRWSWPAAGATFALICMMYSRRQWLPYNDFVVETVGLSILTVFFAALLIIAVTASPASPVHRVCVNHVLRSLGKYSYAIYLFHALLREPLWRHISPYLVESPTEMTWPMRLVFIMIGSGVSFAAAVLSWHLLEKHFLKLKRFFRSPSGRQVQPPLSAIWH
jgi:peptidoglycan/LPS O-acetylase OafA/YrhL